jgi:hypothetical protein
MLNAVIQVVDVPNIDINIRKLMVLENALSCNDIDTINALAEGPYPIDISVNLNMCNSAIAKCTNKDIFMRLLLPPYSLRYCNVARTHFWNAVMRYANVNMLDWVISTECAAFGYEYEYIDMWILQAASHYPSEVMLARLGLPPYNMCI